MIANTKFKPCLTISEVVFVNVRYKFTLGIKIIKYFYNYFVVY